MTISWRKTHAALWQVLIALLWLFVSPPSPLLAQGIASSKVEEEGKVARLALELEQIQSRLASLKAIADSDPALEETLIPRYREAVDELLAARAFLVRAEAYAAAMGSATQKMLELRAPSDGTYAEAIDGALEDASTDQLQRALACLLYTSPSPRDLSTSRMPSSA